MTVSSTVHTVQAVESYRLVSRIIADNDTQTTFSWHKIYEEFILKEIIFRRKVQRTKCKNKIFGECQEYCDNSIDCNNR